MVASESSSAGMQGLKLLQTWQHQSPPQPGGGVQRCCTRGGTRALLSREAWSGAAVHVVAPEPSSAGKRGLELLDTWRHWSAPQHVGGVRSYRTRGSISCSLSYLDASVRGYPVCMVPTVALGPTLGEVAKPQLGQSYQHLGQLF
jgi:hypothetical protein